MWMSCWNRSAGKKVNPIICLTAGEEQAKYIKMKNQFLKSLGVVALILVLASACKDRNSEKRIAELESRLKELEGKKADESKNVNNPLPLEAKPAAEEKPDGPLPEMAFKETEFDFGAIKEGDIVEHTFLFTNNGEAPLIIQEARPSCGCTAPDWTKTPIPVGGQGFVKARFDSNGKTNLQNKTITVSANTWPKQTVLRFKAMVTPKAQQPAEGPVKP
jgi:hypothetical protein